MKYLLLQLWRWFTRGLDWPLMGLTFCISAIGLLTLYSATQGNEKFFYLQSWYLFFSWVILWVVSRIPRNYITSLIPLMYIVVLFLLILVPFYGIAVNNSRRWLSLVYVRIQPSEISKIVVPLAVAYFFHSVGNVRWWHFVVASIIVLLPTAFIFKQPDLGTALLVAASGFSVLYFARMSWKVIFSLFILSISTAPLVWNFLLQDYQRKRIITAFDPSLDALGAGYHIIQSTIAIGSGGIFGTGWLKGTQSHLNFIPERHTDFIFAVFAEERGLIGGILLLVLYTVFLMRCFYIASIAETYFQRLSVASLSIMLFGCLFVNIGMVSGILPVVGLPLPFFSYGGTALISTFAMLGFIMRVSADRKHQFNAYKSSLQTRVKRGVYKH